MAKVTKSRWSECSPKTQMYVSDALALIKDKNNGQVPSHYLQALDMYADLLDVYEKCVEALREQGIMVEDRFGAMVKNPMIKQVLECSVQIQKLQIQMGLTPRSNKQIDVAEVEGQDLIDKLSNI
jgi:P27 family predicted phage terminase small subunit